METRHFQMKKNNKYIENSWKNEINGKRSLKYLNRDILNPTLFGQQYQRQKESRTKMEIIRCRAKRANFNQYTVNPTYKL